MKKDTPEIYPPKRAIKFLRMFLKAELVEEVLGDLEEKFYDILEKKSLTVARRNYWYQTINYLRPFAIKKMQSPNSNYTDMYKNYFKIGFRNLLRNKAYSFINIGGLAVGMTVALLIGLWIYDELSYDTYHENYDRVAQVMQHQTYNGNKGTQQSIPLLLGAELRDKYGSDFRYIVMSSWPGDHILTHGEKRLIKKGSFMDVEAPQLLSLTMLSGTLDGLKEPGSILLSASTAKAFFGELDPMGKVMEIDNELSVKVTGIFEDIPLKARFGELTFVAPWELYISSYEWNRRERDNPNWNNNSYVLFTQIADRADMEEVSEKIKNVKYDKLNESQKTLQSEVFLHPMQDWHLKSNWENGLKKGGLIQYVWLFGIIGIFVLILACINFMNLSTAQSEKRAKEVGVRKSLGSVRGQLISQFLSESILVAVLSFILALCFVSLLIPFFNQLADKQMIFPFANPYFWLISIGFILITGFLAGSYPSFYLSSFHPVQVLKGIHKAGRSATLFRRILVVFQFTVSVVLIIGTIVVGEQIQHSKNRSIGYDNSGVIMIEISTTDYEGKYGILRDALMKRGAVLDMAESSSPMTEVWNRNGSFSWEGKDPNFRPLFSTIWVTHDFGNTIGWEIAEGRDFSRAFTTDSTAYIVNEAAVKYMGLEDPVGKIIRWGRGEHEIIGVAKDIVQDSPFKSVEPTIYILDYVTNTNFIELKLNPDKSISEALALTEEVFAELVPAVPFEYKFADQEYSKKFAAEERIQKLSRIFAILAIFISCLGLFGLAAFMTAQRTKEIGIRKVLGASVFNLWQLLSKDFLVLVILSCFLAVPIAYYGLTNWLENYEYRTELSWWFFVVAGLCVVVITLLTVSYQSIKTALMNPTMSLRSE